MVNGGAHNVDKGIFIFSAAAGLYNEALVINGYEYAGIDINSPSSLLLNGAAIVAAQLANGDDVLLLQRHTDTSPAGYFMRFINAADNANLLLVDYNGSMTLNGGLSVGTAIEMPSSTTGAGVQTFTNSPCTGLTTEQWFPVLLPGHSGTWYVPACQ